MADDDQVQDDQRDADDQDHNDTHESDALGEKGREALKRERDARKTAEKERNDLAKRIADIEKAQKDRDDADAKAKGEWEKVATERQQELDQLKADLAAREWLRRRTGQSAYRPSAAGLRSRPDSDQDPPHRML